MIKINDEINTKESEFKELIDKQYILQEEITKLKNKNEDINKNTEKLSYQNNLKKKLYDEIKSTQNLSHIDKFIQKMDADVENLKTEFNNRNL
jgi:hypothetical protein